MIEPHNHPQADATAEFLTAAFGALAPQALGAVQAVLGNTQFMEVLEAYCFAHESTAHTDVNMMVMREGMRQVVLMVQSTRNLKLETTTGE